MSAVNSPYRYMYETVAASQTGQVLGGVGAKGDYIHRLVVSVNTVATATVTLLDGATSYTLMAGAATLVPGAYSLEVGAVSNTGAWSITTGAGVTVMAIGIFSA